MTTVNLKNTAADLAAYEPMILAWALNGGLAVLAGGVLHLSSTQTAAVTTITTAAAGIWTAARTTPPAVGAITGALGTALVAAGAFGLHLPGPQAGVAVAALSVVLSLILRQNVSPAAKPKTAQGGTPQEVPPQTRT